MSLLQDVLRTQTIDQTGNTVSITERLQTQRADPESDEEIVGVVSAPGTRPASRAPSRPSSPAPRSAARRPFHIASSSTGLPSDPLRAFPTDVSQRVFSQLSVKELARCSRVSKKWNRSQTLNYVWFQHYRKENFHDDSLPPGKWTKRESKQNWRTTHLQTLASRDNDTLGPIFHSYSGRSTPGGSGAQTPREVREDKWRMDAEGESRPSKNEMREMYKELKGRKAKSKFNVGAGAGMRDRGGWADAGEEET
ncbi:uncharacterized protein C8Q71DRAFT_759395 [Rhodofomes roseus]|uniref:F-box domain-containing protein n=1 Tax=Rhodofomes roseus TaxID=34475 RepID=A0A4Y9YC19_9APHY|nr:uncharacterized protein C8Q71DRAFT_759395 [Rhodofomes roseus]KAH9836730.1 hypothetical protein C8Q71DRAFT_759395 [Rhodofomes roseus]TFY60064.1 hypothetical protein EVJ58_g5388 [Rhodofomes roseus]